MEVVVVTSGAIALPVAQPTMSKRSLHFNGHFPGERTWVSQCLLKQRMMEVVVTTGAINRAKLQSNHHHQQTHTQFFYRPDALPVAQPTVSKHRKEINCCSKMQTGLTFRH